MSDLHDLAIFQPRMGRNHRASSRTGGGSFRLAMLRATRLAAWGARRNVCRARSRVAVPMPGRDARRVIIKAHVARMRAGGAKATASLHLRYIERDGVEKDGSKGRFYNAEGPARVEILEEPRGGERHQFRLIVSPEDLRSSTSPITCGA